jgi:hypothetical protein
VPLSYAFLRCPSQVIGAAAKQSLGREQEELQRYGDELDCKIRKCEKEIKALANTLDHLKVRNKNYRDKFMQGAEGADLERK